MKRFVFAAALVALVAPFAGAEEKPATTPPAAAPVVVTGTPVIESAPVVTTATPTRRGLFGRLRNRGTATTTMPATGTTIVTPGTVVTPAPTTAPAPMPMPTPKPDTKPTPNAMTVPPTSGGIGLGNFVAVSTLDSGVVQASATEPVQPRRGLFGRLRNR